MRYNCEHYLVDFDKDTQPWESVKKKLDDLGYVALRNFYDKELINNFTDRVYEIFEKPNLSGSPGYYQKDPYKKMCDTFLVGKPAVDIVANLELLEFIETYMGGSVTIAETFIKRDSGADEVYFPVHSDIFKDWHMGEYPLHISDEQLKRPLGMGAMFYFHETKNGAFCYAEGTHKLGAPFGSNVNNYPDDIQKQIIDSLVRVEGIKGDLVLFNDTGFHGPEQPVSESRTAMLFDYYSDEVFEGVTKAPIPVIINDLGDLTEKQLKSIGLGAPSMIGYEQYHMRKFNRNPNFKWLKAFHKLLFAYDLARIKTINKIKKMLGKGKLLTMSGE